MKILDRALNRDFVRVGRSSIDGQGVFAKRKIPRGARIIEYKGVRRSPAESLSLRARRGEEQVWTFRLDAKTVIDGSTRGNESRFINHSCEPNCEAYVFGKKIFIYALRDIRRYEELTFDYKLRSAEESAEEEAESYPCRCGSAQCRGTMLAARAGKSLPARE